MNITQALEYVKNKGTVEISAGGPGSGRHKESFTAKLNALKNGNYRFIDNPIKQVPYNSVLNNIESRLTYDVISTLPEKTFNTKDLVSEQSWLDATKLQSFFDKGLDKLPLPIVVKLPDNTNAIFQGNHRVGVAHFTTGKVKAKFYDAS